MKFEFKNNIARLINSSDDMLRVGLEWGIRSIILFLFIYLCSTIKQETDLFYFYYYQHYFIIIYFVL